MGHPPARPDNSTRTPPSKPSLLLPLRSLLTLLILAGLLALFSTLYLATQHTVTLEINETILTHRTHERTPQGVLRELGLILQPQDQLDAPNTEAMWRGEPIRVTIARRVMLVHDGSIDQIYTHARRVGEAIDELGAVVLAHDELLLAGARCTAETELPVSRWSARAGVQALLREIRHPVTLSIRRAVPLTLQDGSVPVAIYSTARTVGEALYDHGVLIYEGDEVLPDLDTEITPGLTVYVQRSKPVVLDVAGVQEMLRTRLKTVAELLRARGVELGLKDYVQPDPRTPISRDVRITVVRVADEYFVEEVPIAFETRWEPSEELEIDTSEVADWGREGAWRRQIRVHFENGREVYRTEGEAWLARRPNHRIINYGTNIVVREMQTPQGAITYWRTLRMYATAYNAATAGVSTDKAWYGITRIGVKARKGLVAVDPRVIGLRQSVYVPGYGVGLAADTGGGIKGRRIDLCFDDHNLESWHQWVDVYLLTPVPPRGDIPWIIPNVPKEKG